MALLDWRTIINAVWFLDLRLRAVKGKFKEKVFDKTTIDERLFSGVKKVKSEYRKTLVTALSAGLAFIIALYIRDVLKVWIEFLLKYLNIGVAGTLMSQTIVALIVVALCVVGIIFLGHWQAEQK